MTRGYKFVAGMALLTSGPALAREDQQVWTSVGANVTLSDRWRLSQDVIGRFSDNRDGLYEIESATLLGYKPSKSVTVALGYVHNPQYSRDNPSVIERRVRGQVTVDNIATFAGGKLSARMRGEGRWRDNVDASGWRLRPYVKYSLPLKKGGATSLVLSNETFINLNQTSFQRARGIDRMRNLIAINTPLAKNLALEAGYLNQYGFVADGDDNVDHVASLSLALSL